MYESQTITYKCMNHRVRTNMYEIEKSKKKMQVVMIIVRVH